MKRGILLAAALILFGLPGTSRAEETVVLSLSEAAARAVQNNENVLLQKNALERLQGTYVKVRSGALPQLTGEVLWDRYLKAPVLSVDMGGGPQEFPVKQDWEAQASATLTQVLWAFGKVSTAIDIAKRAIEAQTFATNAAVRETAFVARQAYFALVFSEEALGIAERSHQNALRNQRALEKRTRGGRALRTDLVKTSADVESRFPPVLEARGRRESLLARFRTLIGAPAGAPLALSDPLSKDFPPLEESSLRARALETDPWLQSLRSGRALRDLVVKLRGADSLPTLSAVANLSHGGNGPDAWPEKEMNSVFVAGIRLNVPLWDSGGRSGARVESERDRQEADILIRQRTEALTDEFNDAFIRYTSGVKALPARRSARDAARAAYAIALSSFESGSASQTQLNDAELQLTRMEMDLLTSLYELNVLHARLLSLSGEEPS